MKSFEVGQDVVYLPMSGRRGSYDAKVVKAGRKYVYIDFGQARKRAFDKWTGYEKSDFPPGRIIAREAYEVQKRVDEIREVLRREYGLVFSVGGVKLGSNLEFLETVLAAAVGASQ